MPILSLICALSTFVHSKDANDVVLGNCDRPADTRLWEANGAAAMTSELRDPTDRNRSRLMSSVYTAGGEGRRPRWLRDVLGSGPIALWCEDPDDARVPLFPRATHDDRAQELRLQGRFHGAVLLSCRSLPG